MIRATLAVAAKDLRLRIRDRTAIILAFAGPVLIASILGLAFGSTGFGASYALADGDRSTASKSLLREAFKGFEVVEVSPEEAREAAASGDVSAAVIIPAGFGAALETADPLAVEVVRYSGSELGADVALAVVNGWLDRIATIRLAGATAREAGLPVDPELFAQRIGQADPGLRVTNPRGTTLDAAAYFGPAMALFFLFFSAGYAARTILAERQSGTLDRIVAAPVSPVAVMLGKALPTMVLGLAGMWTTFGLLGVVFGARWGPWYLTALLSVASVFALFGIMSFVASLAKTDQGADSMVSIVALVLAIIGGQFLPADSLPFGLDRLAPLTPNGRALRAFTDLTVGEGLEDLLDDLRVLGFYAVAGSLLGLLRLRKAFAR